MAPTDESVDAADPNTGDDVQVVELSDDENDDLIAEEAPAGHRVNWSWALTAGVIVAVVLIAVTIGAGLATRKEATAATVNGQDITVDQLQDIVDAYRGNGQIAPQFLTNGRVPSDRTARLLQQLVLDRLIRNELARRRALPTAAQIAQARNGIVAQNDPKLIKGFSKEFLDSAAQRSADIDVLAQSVGNDPDGSKFNALLDQLLRKADVRVDPRYGVYAPDPAKGIIIVAPRSPVVKSERTAPTTTTSIPVGG